MSVHKLGDSGQFSSFESLFDIWRTTNKDCNFIQVKSWRLSSLLLRTKHARLRTGSSSLRTTAGLMVRVAVGASSFSTLILATGHWKNCELIWLIFLLLFAEGVSWFKRPEDTEEVKRLWTEKRPQLVLVNIHHCRVASKCSAGLQKAGLYQAKNANLGGIVTNSGIAGCALWGLL